MPCVGVVTPVTESYAPSEGVLARPALALGTVAVAVAVAVA